MKTELATRRYIQALAPAMVLFLAASFAIDWIDDNTDASQLMLAGMAIIPIMLLLSAFWAQWRFINDVDEYIRMIHIKALIGGLAILITVATTWGYLEAYASVRPLGLFWVNPIFWTSYGLFAAILSKRDESAAK